MRPTADTKYLFCCWVVLGCQSLNRFSEPPVGISTFVDFSGLPPVIEGYEQSARYSPGRYSRLRLEFDLGEVPQLALRFTPSQPYGYGGSTAKIFDSALKKLMEMA